MNQLSRRMFLKSTALSSIAFMTTGIDGTVIGSASDADTCKAIRMPSDVFPVLGGWFWRDDDLEPERYKGFVDLVSRHAPYDHLTATLRLSSLEVTDKAIQHKIEDAAAYARRFGIGVVMDLDVRLARLTFAKLYPRELQEMMCLSEFDLKNSGQITQTVTSSVLTDHYTNLSYVQYIPVWGKLARVYSYKIDHDNVIDPNSVLDVTDACIVREAGGQKVHFEIACSDKTQGRKACAMVSFGLMTPAVFAPHLLSFQRAILKQYADSGLSGAAKDEWGFPPCFKGYSGNGTYWYSSYQKEKYAELTGGRDLLRDYLLMEKGEQGRESERQKAINYLLEMSRVRNGQIEQDFYDAAKEIFGPKAIVSTHPTWFPYPGVQEFKKNGLHWWIAKRDWAQTDETTPYCVRTSLSKKWGSPIWYNMYYSAKVDDYPVSTWSHVLGGGRVNYHPPMIVPVEDRPKALLRDGLMRGECRIRLLNFITKTPLDCPVAIVFGHPCAMNWAGPAYADVGLDLAHAFWSCGYPADLIPSTEIGDPALRISDDGYVQYGPQKYQVLVLYHPEFENEKTANFFQAAAKGKTRLYRMGNWTRNFDGEPIQGDRMFPESMRVIAQLNDCVEMAVNDLKELGVDSHTPSRDWIQFDGYKTLRPPAAGHCRLIDGTILFAAGSKNAAGDPICLTEDNNRHKIAAEAVGVLGFRLAPDGTVEALAAGGLRYFNAGQFRLKFETPIDIAMWRDETGSWKGVLQDHDGDIPGELLRFTKQWLQLSVPRQFAG